MATDPVCNMTVDESSAPAKATYEGKTYYFCSDACRTQFQENPKKYAKEQPSPVK